MEHTKIEANKKDEKASQRANGSIQSRPKKQQEEKNFKRLIFICVKVMSIQSRSSSVHDFVTRIYSL
ncbi:unnamed protein product [Rhodiola kirilowii]